MSPRPEPESNQDLAALIAQQLAAMLPDLVAQVHERTRKAMTKSSDRSSSLSEPSTSKNSRKRKSQNYVVATPITQIALTPTNSAPNPKVYVGKLPLCTTCKYHHSAKLSCRRCANCERFGHIAIHCHNFAPAQAPVLVPAPVQALALLASSSDPITLEPTICLVASLTNNHLKAVTLTRKAPESAHKFPAQKSFSKSSTSNNKKRKARSYEVTTPPTQATPIQNSASKSYAGKHPSCNTCSFHHPTHSACRLCTKCGRYGHLATSCRSPTQNQFQAPVQNQAPFPTQATTCPSPPAAPIYPALSAASTSRPAKACFECGNPNHLQHQCPKLVNPNNANAPRGRVPNIIVSEVQASNEERHETPSVTDAN